MGRRNLGRRHELLELVSVRPLGAITRRPPNGATPGPLWIRSSRRSWSFHVRPGRTAFVASMTVPGTGAPDSRYIDPRQLSNTSIADSARVRSLLEGVVVLPGAVLFLGTTWQIPQERVCLLAAPWTRGTTCIWWSAWSSKRETRNSYNGLGGFQKKVGFKLSVEVDCLIALLDWMMLR